MHVPCTGHGQGLEAQPHANDSWQAEEDVQRLPAAWGQRAVCISGAEEGIIMQHTRRNIVPELLEHVAVVLNDQVHFTLLQNAMGCDNVQWLQPS